MNEVDEKDSMEKKTHTNSSLAEFLGEQSNVFLVYSMTFSWIYTFSLDHLISSNDNRNMSVKTAV